MYAVSARTMASAKRKPSQEPEWKVIDLDEVRNRRELERAKEIQAYHARMKAEADDAIRKANMRLRASGAMSLKRIVRRICKAMGVHPDEIFTERRNRDVVLARQAVMYWACRLTRMSLPDIGRRMGRDHTTVLYGRNVYVDKRKAMGRNLRRVR